MIVTEKELRESIDLVAINRLLEELPGFSTFSVEQVMTYFMDPTMFSLSFNKEPGKGYLYSLDLAQHRRHLVNKVSRSFRNALMVSRLQAHLLGDSVLNWGADGADSLIDSLVNCFDIGMGSSVYRLDFASQSCVIKSVQSINGSFYAHILSLCQYPYINLSNFSVQNSFWQLSNYLEGVHFNEFYFQQTMTESIIEQLARHACLGDIFGRGDRHFENYLVSDNTIYPIDVSYLFWPDNDDWLNRYIAGGQSECSLLVLEPDFESLYWKCYHAAFTYFQSLKDSFVAAIQSFYLPGVAKDYERYLLERLEDDRYVINRKQQFQKPLEEYRYRLDYKSRLEQRFQQDAKSLDPLLLMYYYANKDRLTAFFLIDYYERKYLFDLI